jgi:hypothetical protein
MLAHYKIGPVEQDYVSARKVAIVIRAVALLILLAVLFGGR